jgi:hypothetical protein
VGSSPEKVTVSVPPRAILVPAARSAAPMAFFISPLTYRVRLPSSSGLDGSRRSVCTVTGSCIRGVPSSQVSGLPEEKSVCCMGSPMRVMTPPTVVPIASNLADGEDSPKKESAGLVMMLSFCSVW